jgi:hypothetical protein
MSDDLTIYKASTKRFDFTISDENSNLLDLSQDTITFEVSKRFGSTSLFSKTSTSGNSNGQVSFNVDENESDVSSGSYVYELRLDRSTGEKYVAERGNLSVLRGLDDDSTDYLWSDVESFAEKHPMVLDNYSDKEILVLLEDSHSEVQRRAGRYVFDRIRIKTDRDNNLIQDYDLRTDEVLETKEVLDIHGERVDSADYTISDGEISLDQSLVDDLGRGNIITVIYIPELYRELEEAAALKEAYRNGEAFGTDTSRTNTYEERFESLLRQVPRTVMTGLQGTSLNRDG